MNASSYRIAMVAACPFPSLRGSQVFIRELAETLVAAGHEVHVVTYPAGEHMVPIKGMFIHRLRPLAGLDGSRSWWAKLVLDLALIFTLYRVVREHGIELIHAHNYEGPMVAYVVRRLLRVQVVYHSHNAMADELPYYFRRAASRWLARRAGRWLDRTVPRWADYCIGLTPELADYLRRHGVRRDRIAVIPPAVALHTAGEPVPVDDPFPGAQIVLYAGNLDPYQRVDLLLRAFACLRQTHPDSLLVMAVHPARSRRVQRRLSEIGATPGVRLVETHAFGAARRLLGQAHVVVCPRSSWSGFPIKLLNFMSLERAIVVCNSSAKAVSDGVTGVVVPDEDESAMADALRGLLDDPARRAAMGKAAREEAESRYSWAVVRPQIESVYRQLLGDASPVAGQTWRRSSGGTQDYLMAASEDRISPRAPSRRAGSE